MEIGDYIYCHTTGCMDESGEIFAYAGSYYQVDSMGPINFGPINFTINSESGPGHAWSLCDTFYEFFDMDERKPTKNSWEGSRIKFNFI